MKCSINENFDTVNPYLMIYHDKWSIPRQVRHVITLLVSPSFFSWHILSGYLEKSRRHSLERGRVVVRQNAAHTALVCGFLQVGLAVKFKVNGRKFHFFKVNEDKEQVRHFLDQLLDDYEARHY